MTQKKNRGQIIEKGENKFLIRIYLGRDGEGKRQYVSEQITGTRADAEKALTSKLHESDSGRLVITPRVTTGEFLDQWLESIETSIEPRTLLFYGDYIRRYLKPQLGKVKVSALAPITVQSAYAKLSKLGLSPRTVRHCHSVLRNALKWGVRMRLLGVCVTDAVDLPKMEEKAAKAGGKMALTSDEAKSILSIAEANNDRLTALWRVLLECGLRPGEARALRWSDIGTMTVEGKTYRTLRVERAVQVVRAKPRVEEIRGTKTKRSKRTIPLTPACVEALEEHRRRQVEEMMRLGPNFERNELIFAGPRGGIMSGENLLKRWRDACRAAQVPTLRAYAARHTTATLLLEAGIPLKVVSEILGHSTIAQTADTYSHVTATMAVAATAAMESTLSSSRRVVSR